MTMILVRFDADAPNGGDASYSGGYRSGYDFGKKLGVVTRCIYSEYSDMTIYRPVLRDSPGDPVNTLVLYSQTRSKADLDKILQKACDGLFRYDIVDISHDA